VLRPVQRITTNVRLAISGWKNEPEEMIAKAIVSFALGQGLYWKLGSDQLGISMDPKVTMGKGLSIGKVVYSRLPHTSEVAWGIKVIEIITDAARGPIEALVYERHGLTPDGVCTLITPPLWPYIEALEKTHGAIKYPERVTLDAQVAQSLANIYGNLFRYGHTGVLLIAGDHVNKRLTPLVTRALQALFRKVS
jgi:hypothetical protein